MKPTLVRKHRPASAPGPHSPTNDEIVELAEMFRLLGEPSRLRIVLACLDQPANVGAMAERLGLSDSLVSHHLRLLRAARLLKAERHGKQVFYVVADDHVRTVVSDMVAHVAEPRAEEDD
jgi:ArsR family transcriptional regulator, lead/cadmium/zinc/bismuth-responsive transcriptional repressor